MDEAEAVLAWLMKPNAGASVGEILAELVNRPVWHADAACRGVGTATFFPVQVGDPGADEGSEGVLRPLSRHGGVLADGPRQPRDREELGGHISSRAADDAKGDGATGCDG